MGNKSSLMLQDDEIKQISGQTGFSPQQVEKLYSRFTQLDRTNSGSLSKTDLLSIPELAINPLCDRLIEMFFYERDQDDEQERINFRQFMHVLAAFRTNQQRQQQQSNRNSPPPTATRQQKSADRNGNNSAESEEGKSSSEDENSVAARIFAPAAGQRPRSQGRRMAHKQQQQHRTKALRGGPIRLTPPPPTTTTTTTSATLMTTTRGEQPLNDSLAEKLYFVFKIYDNDNDGRISFNDLRSILKMMVGNYIEDVQLDKIATRAFVEVDQDNDGFIEFGEFCKVFAGKDMEDKLRVKFC